MKGTFEIHLITTPEKQTQLFGYITNLSDGRLIRPRPTCAYALYGNYPNQPMLTFWTHGTIEEVNVVVNDIKSDMEKNNIPIIRTKIEAMAHNEGVPNICTDNHYFEFHFKVMIKNTTEWNRLVELLTPFGAHLFYNPYNKSLTPIVTIRRYTSLTDLDNVYETVKSLLEENEFVSEDPEKEYSVYDSNVYLDQNWLFVDKPTNFIITVDKQMVFAN
ncbi:hypothetical protein QKU48_gp1202 [Fadolivirus algeromassiliense]|jgi:hypothetical protein|uniref:Uncharacterized protein n=1 Tax=Fadolivirus FV1/VV64 TaxID=3070911 RepID=A0A7D3QXP7_9VIRU|nr:hypothetical protein QKU48_gp1202 [Fadolivirus algeromassiliense]QKF94660.1 hypothetical protein Fadolivirus_1_1202 [Fadolivirus FV1/VV64]